MDEKTIRERLAKLREQHEQATANVHALSGAIQDCEYWLEQVKKPAQPVHDTPFAVVKGDPKQKAEA
jgi:hypothetical protein